MVRTYTRVVQHREQLETIEQPDSAVDDVELILLEPKVVVAFVVVAVDVVVACPIDVTGTHTY